MRILILLVIAGVIFTGTAIAGRNDSCADAVRLDEENVRIFVVCPDISEMNDADITQLVVDIFSRLEGLSDEYFISFFARDDIVGYKTDEKLADDVASGDWANAYLGEYYTHSHRITLWPAIPAKRTVRQLPAPK